MTGARFACPLAFFSMNVPFLPSMNSSRASSAFISFCTASNAGCVISVAIAIVYLRGVAPMDWLNQASVTMHKASANTPGRRAPSIARRQLLANSPLFIVTLLHKVIAVAEDANPAQLVDPVDCFRDL